MQIDVWSDFACPWCALGLYRLEAACRAFEHGDRVTVVHRSFELDPRAPARRERSMEAAVAAKYGLSAERVRAGHDQITALGKEVGLAFDFGRVQLGSTFDAHRLAQAARGTESEGRVVRELFAAHFSEGRQLSDHEVLRDVARSTGLPGHVAENVLATDAYADAVRADEAAAADYGVSGVPLFLIGGVWPVPGAQDIETMLLLLRRAWSRLGH
jgi:predicted DsbA family dithiol-disulfide isomerase